jgi:hypothetical protein
MTREEFESILEEAYNDGYNQAIEDIQEDILDEEAFDLEGEYNYYTESRKPQYAQASRAQRYAERVYGIPADRQHDIMRKVRDHAHKGTEPSASEVYKTVTKGTNLNQRINMAGKASAYARKNRLKLNDLPDDGENFVAHGGKRKW